jgi:hypothetical protein
MTQRIREAERELKYEEYAGREGDIVTGIIQQNDSRYTLLDLGRVEALLPQAEQVPYERPSPHARLKAYIVEVRKTAKGPQIVVSRTHPGLIKRAVRARGARDRRRRRRDQGLRPRARAPHEDRRVVQRLQRRPGRRLRRRPRRPRPQVVNELRGEKIDIVPFSDDPYEFVAKALSPAKVKEVRIDEDTGTARSSSPTTSCPGHRQGGPERPPRRPPHRLAGRHQERDPARRGGGLRRRGLGRGRVGRRRGDRRAGLGRARRGRPTRTALALRRRAFERSFRARSIRFGRGPRCAALLTRFVTTSRTREDDRSRNSTSPLT